MHAIRPHDEILAFLPMLYVAWADGELGGDELEAIRAQVDARTDLSEPVRVQLERWLDARDPPSPYELAALLGTIRAHAPASRARRFTLAELGHELSTSAGQAAPDAALRDIEDSLGILGTEASRELLAAPRPSPPLAPPPEVVPAPLRAFLDGPEAAARDAVRDFLRQRSPHDLEPRSTAEYRALVLADLRALAATGVADAAFPGVTTDAATRPQAAQGGSRSAHALHPPGAPFLAAMETLGFGDLSLWVKAGVQFGLFGGSVYALGTERHRAALLPGVAAARILGCFAMTELGHGSNVMELRTNATYDPDTDELVVHTPDDTARKEYIGGAAEHATIATVFARLRVGGADHGIHAMLVPIRDADGQPLPGVRLGDSGPKMGLHGVDNGRIWFDRVRIPRDQLLDRFASITADGEYESDIASPNKRFFTMLGTLVKGRVAVASAAVSATKVGLTIAVRYALMRRQFGPADGAETLLLDYRTHQRRLFPALAATYAMHFGAAEVQALAAVADPEEEASRRLETFAAGLKAAASWHATSALQLCRECCGGRGYMLASRLPALRCDTDVFTTFEGDNTVLMQLVAKSLLADFRTEFEESRYMALLKQITRRAATALAEKNPVMTRRRDPEHLRDPELHAAAFRYREAHLLTGLAQRIAKRIAAGMDTFEALLAVQDHAVTLARAHMDRVLYDLFAAAVARFGLPEGPPLVLLRDLYALSTLEATSGWYLETDYINDEKAKAIRKQAIALCDEIRPHALAFVDAFGIPESCLGAIFDTDHR